MTILSSRSNSFGSGYLSYLSSSFNTSQLHAISQSIVGYGVTGGVTLIKGPPGTGKTHTLLGVINSLCVRQVNIFHAKIVSLINTATTLTANGIMTDVAVAKSKWKDALKSQPRILVCAPSNGAVDNIILKMIKSSFVDGAGLKYKPGIVRVGAGVSKDLKGISLEDAVNNVFESASDLTSCEVKINEMKGKLEGLSNEVSLLQQRIVALKVGTKMKNLPLQWEIRCCDDFATSKRVYYVDHTNKTTSFEKPPPSKDANLDVERLDNMPQYIDALKALVSRAQRYSRLSLDLQNLELAKGKTGRNARVEIENNILEQRQIVFVTLGSAGAPALQRTKKFEVVIVDEAGQCIEPSTLVALDLGSNHAILVGDPQQLPATVFSKTAKHAGYDVSLFQRMESGGMPVCMLDVQYRMHPHISEFPRKRFYEELLFDADKLEERAFGIRLRMKKLRALSVVNCCGRESKVRMSYENKDECNACIAIARILMMLMARSSSSTSSSRSSSSSESSIASKIGIIAPYSGQVNLLKKTFGEMEEMNGIEVNTIDGFQGREKEIIIFSCVRAGNSNSGGGIGFLSDLRRMNVGLTRAREMMIVVADVERVRGNKDWRTFLDFAGVRGGVVGESEGQSGITLRMLQIAPSEGEAEAAREEEMRRLEADGEGMLAEGTLELDGIVDGMFEVAQDGGKQKLKRKRPPPPPMPPPPPPPLTIKAPDFTSMLNDFNSQTESQESQFSPMSTDIRRRVVIDISDDVDEDGEEEFGR